MIHYSWRLDKGFLYPSDEPGIGVEFNEMSASDTTSVVRVPYLDANYTKRVLAAGAECDQLMTGRITLEGGL